MKIIKTEDISDRELHYSFGYYTENKFLDEKRIVLLRGNTPELTFDSEVNEETELLILDIETKEITKVASGISAFTDFLVHGSIIYYVKESALIAYNANTHREITLFSEKGIGSPHISDDGKYLSLFSCTPQISRFFRIDTVVRKGELLFEKAFPDPNPYANHGMISPTDKDVLFFAHEGDTRQVADRLWIYNAKEGKSRNIAPQSTDDQGLPIDCFGHEAWAHDGSGLYFVKYRESRTKSGICYSDINGSAPTLLYNKYDYWHVGTSKSGRYLTADTRNLGKDRSGVVVIDKVTGEEHLIDTPEVTFRHPCHPHPQLSPGDTRLVYHFKNQFGKTSVKILSLDLK